MIKNVRVIASMAAFDLDVDSKQRVGYQLFQQAVKEGAGCGHSAIPSIIATA